MSTVYDLLDKALDERLAENEVLVELAENMSEILEDAFIRIRSNMGEINELTDALKCEADHIERVEELTG